MKPTTLKTRLLLGSLLILPLVLLVTGAALDKAYRTSLFAAEKVRLERYFYLLFSLAEFEDGALTLPQTLIEPDLERPSSGVYAYLFGPERQRLWRSGSSRLVESPPGAEDFGRARQPGQLNIARRPGREYDAFYASFDVLWETDTGVTIPYRFALVHDGDSYYSALQAFRRQLAWGLALALATVLIAQALLLIWALKPLTFLARALARMHSGETQLLTGRYPGEIQQVVDSLNGVLESESKLRLRYHNSLGDLAHSLKTPLAVLKSASPPAGAEHYSRQVIEQVERMDQVVRYQLQKAVNEQGTGRREQIQLSQALERLGQSLQKIYRDKGINLALDADESLMFVGHEQDLMEILGNLLDNGFKYGRSQVTVEAQLQGDWLHITVDDDGDGIAESLRDDSLERGKRLDTSKPGQGIGLAICADIAAGYHGQLKIARSPLGGARFTVKIPGALGQQS